MRALAVALALAAACGGSAPPVAPAARAAQLAADPLAFLPRDAVIVGYADVVRLRTSPAWRRVEAALVSRIHDAVIRFRVGCGFDPIASIRSIVLGLRDDVGGEISGAFVVRGVDRDGLLRCMKMGAGEDGVDIFVEGEVITFAAEATEGPLVIGFADATTAVATMGPGTTAATVHAALAAGAPLREAPAFRALVADPAMRRTLWLAADGNAKLFHEETASVGVMPRLLIAAVELAQGIEGSLRLRFDSAADAEAVRAMAVPELANLAAAGATSRLDAVARDRDVVFTAAMTPAQLDAAVDALLGWLGGA